MITHFEKTVCCLTCRRKTNVRIKDFGFDRAVSLVPIPFWTVGHGQMAGTPVTASGGEMCLWDWELICLISSVNSGSNLLMISIYHAARDCFKIIRSEIGNMGFVESKQRYQAQDIGITISQHFLNENRNSPSSFFDFEKKCKHTKLNVSFMDIQMDLNS